MRFRKLACILPALSLLSTLPTLAYAQQDSPAEIRFSWWGGSQRHKATNEALDAFRKKYPHITVRAEYSGFDGYLSKFSTQMAAGEEADLVRIDWNWLPRFSRDGNGFYDLRQVSDTVGLKNFKPADIALSTINGKIQGIPVSISYRTFFYNKTTWQQAGIPYPTTWDELFAAAKTFKEKLGDNYYPLSLTSGVVEALDILSLCRNYMVQKYGVDLIDEENKKLGYTKEQIKEFIAFYKKLVDEHVIPSQVYYAGFGKGNTNETKQWINGMLGGMFIWTSSYNNYSSSLKTPSDLQLGPFISMPGAKDSAIDSKPVAIYSISKHSKHPKETALLINFLLNEKAGVEALMLNNGVPTSIRAGEIIAGLSVTERDATILESYKYVSNQPETKIPLSIYLETPELIKLWSEVIQQLDYKKMTVDSAADYFESSANRILKKAMR